MQLDGTEGAVAINSTVIMKARAGGHEQQGATKTGEQWAKNTGGPV